MQKKKKIKVYNSPGIFTESVCVFALGLMISASRKIIELNQNLKDSNWHQITGDGFEGKTLGIVGYGDIGKRLYSLLKPLKLKILVNEKNKNKINKKISFCSKKNLILKSDFIIIAADLNKSSFHFLDKNEFKILKKEVVIINIARGPIINNKELILFLKKNLKAFACLDVFENEPLTKNNPFTYLKNCIITPHNAYNTNSSVQNTNFNTVKNLIKGLNIKNV